MSGTASISCSVCVPCDQYGKHRGVKRNKSVSEAYENHHVHEWYAAWLAQRNMSFLASTRNTHTEVKKKQLRGTGFHINQRLPR